MLPIIVGLATGGFVARLGIELTARLWPWPLIVAVGGLLMGAGGLCAWWLTTSARDRAPEGSEHFYWPLLLLALYLFWPQRQPFVALQVLFLAGLATLWGWYALKPHPTGVADAVHLHGAGRTSVRLLNVERLTDISTFVLSLSLYLITAAPGVLPADSGEFQIVAPLQGVAHPPGYPLYTLLGWLMTRLIPFGTEAYRLNLMSAFLAAGTLSLLGAATRRWARHLGVSNQAALVGGLIAALTLGTATTFWSQGTVANIRMPTMLASALGLCALARYDSAGDQRQADRALITLAVALGFGVGHHPSLIFLGFFFLVYLFWVDSRLLVQPRRWWKPLLAILITFLPLLYLPLRGAADARLAPPDLDTIDGFVHHVTAQGFEGDMFAFANAEDLPQRLILVPTLFLFQFNPALLAAAAFGLFLLAWRDRRLLVLLAGGLALHTFVSITYRAPQTVEYLMPAYLPLAILVGLATAWLLSPSYPRFASRAIVTIFSSPLAALLAVTTLLAGLNNGLDHGPSYFSLSDDHSTRVAMESLLEQAPPDALILADWHWATPLWYLQWVEGQRPDVEVRYVYPVPGQEYGDTWKDRVAAADGERPLLLTHAYDLSGYTLEPFESGFWIHPRPHFATPAATTPLNAVFGGDGEGRLDLLGYALSRQQANPGGSLELTLAWRALEEFTAAPSFAVGLANTDGQRLSQADRFLGVAVEPNEVRFERLVLPLYHNIAPGNYDLTVQVYSTSAEGFTTWSLRSGEGSPQGSENTLHLTNLPLVPNSTRPHSLHPLAAPFVEGPTLVGVDYDRSVRGTLRVYLHWSGPTQGGEQVRVGERTVQLPALADGAYQTVVLDLTDDIKGRLRLTLTGKDHQIKSVPGPWGWPLKEVRLPDPSPTARFVPLSDEMALIGVSPAAGEPVASNGQLLVRPTFLSLKPLVNDNAVSVRLVDAAGQWRDMHDLQPALGAIPTLKWIRGSRIVDPHPLQVSNDITGATVGATVVVYERFRGTPLPSLDGRLGEISLGEWLLVGH